MGGGGGDTVTNTYTGLGDDQFANLQGGQGTIQENQANIASSIDAAKGDASSAYSNIYGRFDDVDSGLGINEDLLKTLRTRIGVGGSDPTGLYQQFALQNKDVEAGFGDLKNRFGQVNTNIGQAKSAVADSTKALKDYNKGRFDDLDTSVGDTFDAVGEVQSDVTDIDRNTQNLSGDISTLATDSTKRFNTLDSSIDDGFGDAQTSRENIEQAASGERDDIVDDLSDLGRAQDTYYEDVSGTLGDVENTTDQFVTSFDDYIDRYGDDVDQAVEERSNILTGTEQEMGRLRDDLGEYTQAVSGYASDTDAAIDTGFSGLGETVEGGFQEVDRRIGGGLDAMSEDVSSLFDAQNSTLTDQGSELLSIGMNLEGLSDQQRNDMQFISGAFDRQGNLIRTGQDEMGNLVEREIDANGNLIERKFDDQGNLLGETALNVNDVISGLNQLDTISGQIQQGFEGVQDTFGEQEGMMAEMSADQQQQFSDTQDQILTGFDETSGTMDATIRDLASVSSQMDDLDIGMRQQFYQLGAAFDDNGELITETVDDNGNMIRRSIDINGNILLQAFDNTGEEIGQNVININNALMDLADLDTIPGANYSMGNLSPAMQADPRSDQPNVPTSGFMAPYTETR